MKALACALTALLLSACGLSQSPTGSFQRDVQVVAAENFWGSIAAQIGGDHATVTSIISNPQTDPHDYDPTPQDARILAQANYVIVNGAGYDAWAAKLLAANPAAARTVLTVGDLVGKKEGDNPHLWYSPAYVEQVIARVAIDLGRYDPADSTYFQQRATVYETVALKDYDDTINAIKTKYAGTKVGASESIFAYLAEGTGLDLITPAGYLNAISEGADPSATDKATVEDQIATRAIKVLVYNSQNSTPEVQGLVNKAKTRGIPVVQITETMVPATATFQEWQTTQLKALLRALGG